MTVSPFVLRRRGPLQFLRDRAKRLLVPLAFGMVVIVPPQIWYERLDTGATTLDFWAWWPSVFTTGTYPQGNFSYHHLWFIFDLFIYAVLLLPAMAWARTPRGAAALERARGWIAAHGVHQLAVPIVTTYALLVQQYSGQQDIVHDVAMVLTYFGYFAAGWVLGTHDGVWTRLVAGRHRAFTGAAACLIVINQVRWNDLDPAPGWSPVGIAWMSVAMPVYRLPSRHLTIQIDHSGFFSDMAPLIPIDVSNHQESKPFGIASNFTELDW